MKSILKNTLKTLGVSALLASGVSAGGMGVGIGVQLFGGAFKTEADELSNAVGYSLKGDFYTNINTVAGGAAKIDEIEQKAESTVTNMFGSNYSAPWGVGLSACYMFDFGMVKVGPRVAFDFFFADDAKQTKAYDTTGEYNLGKFKTETTTGGGATAPDVFTTWKVTAISDSTAGFTADQNIVGVKNSWQARAYVDVKHCGGFGVFGGVHWSKTTGCYGDKDLGTANTISFAFGLGGMSKITSNIAAFFNAGYKLDFAGTEIDFSDSGLNVATAARTLVAAKLEVGDTTTTNPTAVENGKTYGTVLLPLGTGDAKIKADGSFESGGTAYKVLANHKVKRNGFFGEVGLNFMF